MKAHRMMIRGRLEYWYPVAISPVRVLTRLRIKLLSSPGILEDCRRGQSLVDEYISRVEMKIARLQSSETSLLFAFPAQTPRYVLFPMVLYYIS
jgi:hypothetical protein